MVLFWYLILLTEQRGNRTGTKIRNVTSPKVCTSMREAIRPTTSGIIHRFGPIITLYTSPSLPPAIRDQFAYVLLVFQTLFIRVFISPRRHQRPDSTRCLSIASTVCHQSHTTLVYSRVFRRTTSHICLTVLLSVFRFRTHDVVIC